MRDWYFKIKNKEHSRAIQNKLFEQGYRWASGDTVPMYLDAKGITLENDQMRYLITEEDIEDVEKKGVKLKTLDDLYFNDHFVIGKYYKANKKHHFRLFKYSGNLSIGFGSMNMFATDLKTGHFSEKKLSTSGYTEATEKEWIEALKEEAKKRGFNVTRRFRSTGENVYNVEADEPIESYIQAEGGIGLIKGIGTGMIYSSEGKWGEPLDVLEDRLPTLRGYVGRDEGDKISYGCATFSKDWILSREFKYLNSLNVEGHRINRDELDKVQEYVKRHKPYKEDRKIIYC